MVNIAIQGRLWEDATYRTTAAGKPVVTLKIPLYTGKTGDKYNPSQWYTVIAWEGLAEQCKGYSKGDKVIVYGQLTYREWQGKEGVQKVFEIRASHVAKGDEIPLPKSQAKQTTESYARDMEDGFIPEVEEDDVPL